MVRPSRSAQPASCLNLVLACIVYWQAWEISRVLSQCDRAANGVDTSLLKRVSPIEWDNVVLNGSISSTGSSSADAVPQKGSLFKVKSLLFHSPATLSRVFNQRGRQMNFILSKQVSAFFLGNSQ